MHHPCPERRQSCGLLHHPCERSFSRLRQQTCGLLHHPCPLGPAHHHMQRLHLLHHLEQQGDGEDVELEDWVDVSQSLGDRSRYIEKSSTVNTLLPGSKWVMRHRRRVLSGIEALSIQGLHWKSYEAHGTHWKVIRSMFTDRQLCDLAGNAFDANSMLVALVVAMKLCEVSEKATGIPRSLPPVARLTGDPPSPSTSCDDSEGSPESVAGPIPGERFRALELLSNSWFR